MTRPDVLTITLQLRYLSNPSGLISQTSCWSISEILVALYNLIRARNDLTVKLFTVVPPITSNKTLAQQCGIFRPEVFEQQHFLNAK